MNDPPDSGSLTEVGLEVGTVAESEGLLNESVEEIEGIRVAYNDHDKAIALDWAATNPFHGNVGHITMEEIIRIVNDIPGARTYIRLNPTPKLSLRDHRKIHSQDSLSLKCYSFYIVSTKHIAKLPLSISARRVIPINDSPHETHCPTPYKHKPLTKPNTLPKNNQPPTPPASLLCPRNGVL